MNTKQFPLHRPISWWKAALASALPVAAIVIFTEEWTLTKSWSFIWGFIWFLYASSMIAIPLNSFITRGVKAGIFFGLTVGVAYIFIGQ